MQFRNILQIMTFAVAAGAGVAEAAPVPDFSGAWNHPGIPGFEPLSTGPTSLVNLLRREGNVANNRQPVGDYRNPILKPETAITVKKFGEMSLDHYGYPTPRNQCWPGGVPFEFTNTGLMLLQKPDEILLLYRLDHQVRHVRMNQTHPANLVPSWYGDSVGHYEGDTLVVDTVGVKIGPYAMLDWYGTPHSPALHVIERYRMLDYAAAKEALDRSARENFIPFPPRPKETDKFLQLRFTVEDPAVFTTPWSATVTYLSMDSAPGRARQAPEWDEEVCAENLNKYGTEKDPDVPTAPHPDF
jgi:hypothetical protein